MHFCCVRVNEPLRFCFAARRRKIQAIIVPRSSMLSWCALTAGAYEYERRGEMHVTCCMTTLHLQPMTSSFCTRTSPLSSSLLIHGEIKQLSWVNCSFTQIGRSESHDILAYCSRGDPPTDTHAKNHKACNEQRDRNNDQPRARLSK